MELTIEEREMMEGKHGKTLAKVIRTVVEYGTLFGAQRLIPLDKPVHLVTSFGVSILKPVYNMMNELIENGLHTVLPFTVDPRPLDHKNIHYSLPERLVFKIMYGKQKYYEKQLMKIGLKNENAFTCTCYFKEIGDIPEKGDILAWAESSAVVYANSVIGARTNRNSAIIDLFSGILGKTPEFGFLTNEGRKAKWLIELKTHELPPAQVLGSTIGLKVTDEVPYIKGLDKFLKNTHQDDINDYLKEMGAASASNGAVGLFHIENITPEAVDEGEKLLMPDFKTYYIDDNEIKKTRSSYPVMWINPGNDPELCFIGCPHLSLQQLNKWTDAILEALDKTGRKKIKIKTILTAAPDVVRKFKENKHQFMKLKKTSVRLSSVCPLMNMNNPLFSKKAVITNSNKLRTYSTAKYYDDHEILNIITGGNQDETLIINEVN
jgi:predicted aconitase